MHKPACRKCPMKCSGIDIASGAPVEVSFDRTHHRRRAPAFALRTMRALSAPGWIDLQVNGFAGVDYNSPASSHEEIARSIRAHVRHRRHALFPTVITGSPDNMLGGAAQSRQRQGDHPGRRRRWRLPRRRPLHLARRRPARRASAPLGPPARSRRIPPLPGCRARPHPPGDALARLAAGAPLHRSLVAEGRRRQHRPHRAPPPRKSPTP